MIKKQPGKTYQIKTCVFGLKATGRKAAVLRNSMRRAHLAYEAGLKVAYKYTDNLLEADMRRFLVSAWGVKSGREKGTSGTFVGDDVRGQGERST